MIAQEAVAFLAGKRRTVLLGGMAVILHGLSRNTKDYDIWLDPLPDEQRLPPAHFDRNNRHVISATGH